MGTSLSWMTDAQLHDAVRRELDEQSDIGAHDIAVVASDGVITLTGFVDGDAEKLLAEQTVKRVRGVCAVANDMEVKVRPADRPGDRQEAVHALQSHANLP